MYGKGISNEGCLVDLAVSQDVIEKSGSWFSYNSQRLGQGKENIKAILGSNPELFAEIEAKVKANLISGNSGISTSSDDSIED